VRAGRRVFCPAISSPSTFFWSISKVRSRTWPGRYGLRLSSGPPPKFHGDRDMLEIHEAFMSLACAVICQRYLRAL
jgi:hypothetical protein